MWYVTRTETEEYIQYEIAEYDTPPEVPGGETAGPYPTKDEAENEAGIWYLADKYEEESGVRVMNTLRETTDFDRFFAAYVRAALWSTAGEQGAIERGEPEDTSLESLGFTFDSLAPATREAMLRDCAKFWQGNTPSCSRCPEFAGGDFWLTRNHHGSGFWDGDWPTAEGGRLTTAAHEFPEVDLYIGEDGLIYQVPA